MTARLKSWLTIDSIISALDTLGYVLVIFLYWNQQLSLYPILRFNLVTFFSIFLAVIPVHLLLVRFSAKSLYLFGVAIKVFTFLFVAANFSDFGMQADLVGALYGISFAIMSGAKPVLSRAIVQKENLYIFKRFRETFSTGLAIFLPVLVFVGINNLGYDYSFWGLALAMLITAVVLYFLPVRKLPQSLNLKIIQQSSSNKIIRRYALISLGIGMGSVFLWGVLDLMLLQMLGDLTSWRNVALLLALFAAVFAYALRNFSFTNKLRSFHTVLFATVIYLILSLILGSFFSLEIFVVVLVAKIVFDKMSDNIVQRELLREVERDPMFEYKQNSYQMLNELYRAMGRIIPVALLLLIPDLNLTTQSLILVLVLLAMVPAVIAMAVKTYLKGLVIEEI